MQIFGVIGSLLGAIQQLRIMHDDQGVLVSSWFSVPTKYTLETMSDYPIKGVWRCDESSLCELDAEIVIGGPSLKKGFKLKFKTSSLETLSGWFGDETSIFINSDKKAVYHVQLKLAKDQRY